MDKQQKAASAANLQSLLSQHQARSAQLAKERLDLARKQADVLRGYVSAGLSLPDNTQATITRDHRQMLVEQLIQQESAARASLEALKAGKSLAAASEVAVKVYRQDAEPAGAPAVPTLAQQAGGQQESKLVLAPLLVAGLKGGAAPQKLQRVTSFADLGRGGGTRPVSGNNDPGLGDPHATSSGNLDTWSGRPSYTDDIPVQRTGSRAAAAAAAAAAGAAGLRGISAQRPGRLPPLQHQFSARQAAESGGGSVESAPAAFGQSAAAPFAAPAAPATDPHLQAQLQEIKQQMAQLSNLLSGSAGAAQQQQQRWQGCPPQQNGYWQPGALVGPWMDPFTQGLQMGMAQSAAAAAAAAAGGGGGGHGAAAGHGGGLGHALPPSLAHDPVISHAHDQHMRQMLLLQMELDRAKTTAELQQVRSQLSQLQVSAGAAALGGYQSQPDYGGMQQQLGQQRDITSAPAAAGYSDPAVAGRYQDGGLGDSEEEVDGKVSAPGMPADEPALQLATQDLAAEAWEEETLTNNQPMAAGDNKGTVVSRDVLSVWVQTAGPFSRKGNYRLVAVLYEGYQPVDCGPDSGPADQIRASTGKKAVMALGGTATGAVNHLVTAGADQTAAAAAAAAAASGWARFAQSLPLKGFQLNPAHGLVFEVYMSKQGVAGLPMQETLVAWAMAPILIKGKVAKGIQSVPLYRLPILLTAPRKFSYDNAQIDFKVTLLEGAPGDMDLPEWHHANQGVKGPQLGLQHEDIPGVPTSAWVKVQRGIPPADPYSHGDGLVVLVDGARFLPANITITQVVVGVWSSQGMRLEPAFDGVCLPDSDAYSPRYSIRAAIGLGQSTWEDCTATLMMQVHTIERYSRSLKVVGFALLPLFLDPTTGQQPTSRSIQDYVLNEGAFQIPIHAGAPATNAPLRDSSLALVPRLPCSSVLVRIMNPERAKLLRRQPPPLYEDRMYDTMRAWPTLVEKRLYAKLLQRKALNVRDAARLVSRFLRQPREMFEEAPRSRIPPEDLNGPPPLFMRWLGSGGVPLGATSAAAAAAARLGSSDADVIIGNLYIGDPSLAVPENPAEVEESKNEGLPPSDPEIMDWMADTLAAARAAQMAPAFINLNAATEYQQELGFYVAVDGACRLGRLLPTAALISLSPPAGLYQDHPVIDDIKVTLDYDLDAPLAAPRWLDGYQHFAGASFEPSLVVLIDVRSVVPGTSTSAPMGWALLPVFERAGCFVASGAYQLPLFQGVPGQALLSEITAKGDPMAVVGDALAEGRLRPMLDASSVLVRLMCGSRVGQLQTPASTLDLELLRLPPYCKTHLAARLVNDMRKPVRNKTYRAAKPKNLTDEQWVDLVNDTIIKVAGLDEQLATAEEEGIGGDGADGQAAMM